MENRTMKAVAYIRYIAQTSDKRKSMEMQMAAINGYAEAHGIEIENYYVDMGKNGKNADRPQYQKMKSDLESEKVEAKILIVNSLDRLHRNAVNLVYDLEWLEDNDIRFISVTEDYDTWNEESMVVLELT